jgi:hypothetical protein
MFIVSALDGETPVSSEDDERVLENPNIILGTD